MKTTLLFFIMISVAISALAQERSVWKGGKPGRANDWKCAANWSTNQVPDAFSDVIIPKTTGPLQNYPVIRSGRIEVNTLRIQCGARLTIAENASLSIFNPDYCDDVSRILVLGKLELPGRSASTAETTFVSRLQ